MHTHICTYEGERQTRVCSLDVHASLFSSSLSLSVFPSASRLRRRLLLLSLVFRLSLSLTATRVPILLSSFLLHFIRFQLLLSLSLPHHRLLLLLLPVLRCHKPSVWSPKSTSPRLSISLLVLPLLRTRKMKALPLPLQPEAVAKTATVTPSLLLPLLVFFSSLRWLPLSPEEEEKKKKNKRRNAPPNETLWRLMLETVQAAEEKKRTLILSFIVIPPVRLLLLLLWRTKQRCPNRLLFCTGNLRLDLATCRLPGASLHRAEE